MEGRAGGGSSGDYISSLLTSSPMLDFGVLDGAVAAGGDCLEKFCGDPGFAERAARLSSFNGQHFAPGLFGMPPPPPGCEFGGSREASSVSDPASAMKDANAKKRKAPAAKGKAKEPSLSTSCQVGEQKESDAKRCRTGDAEKKAAAPVRPKAEQAGSDSSVEDGEQRKCKGKNAKPVEPPKDYVHVRARRGQATDSHSLAERVRRERISQRMKFLQDLVPGCNKVIGKALMLDEIINYVQSLQRQVEFLSMKLATVNPLDFSNLSTLLHKDMYGPSASSVFSLESSSSAFPFSDQGDVFQSFLPNSMESQCTLNQLDLALSQATNAAQYTFQDGTATVSTNLQQQRNFWEDDLQSVFHVDNRQSQDNGVSAESFHGDLQAGQMKMEF